MLTTGVAAFGLNNADDGGSGLSDHGSHSKISHEKKFGNSFMSRYGYLRNVGWLFR